MCVHVSILRSNKLVPDGLHVRCQVKFTLHECTHSLTQSTYTNLPQLHPTKLAKTIPQRQHALPHISRNHANAPANMCTRATTHRKAESHERQPADEHAREVVRLLRLLQQKVHLRVYSHLPAPLQLGTRQHALQPPLDTCDATHSFVDSDANTSMNDWFI